MVAMGSISCITYYAYRAERGIVVGCDCGVVFVTYDSSLFGVSPCV